MTDNFEKKVAVDGPVVNAGELGSSTFSQARLCRQARWDLASDGRWRASVRSFCGFCVTSRCNFCRASGVEIFRLEQSREKAIGGIDRAPPSVGPARLRVLHVWLAAFEAYPRAVYPTHGAPRVHSPVRHTWQRAPPRPLPQQRDPLALHEFGFKFCIRSTALSLPPPWRQSPCGGFVRARPPTPRVALAALRSALGLVPQLTSSRE